MEELLRMLIESDKKENINIELVVVDIYGKVLICGHVNEIFRNVNITLFKLFKLEDFTSLDISYDSQTLTEKYFFQMEVSYAKHIY